MNEVFLMPQLLGFSWYLFEDALQAFVIVGVRLFASFGKRIYVLKCFCEIWTGGISAR